MSDLSKSREIEEYCPDAELQLAINAYRNIKKTLGIGTLTKLQRLIEDLPLTKAIEKMDIHSYDDGI